MLGGGGQCWAVVNVVADDFDGSNNRDVGKQGIYIDSSQYACWTHGADDLQEIIGGIDYVFSWMVHPPPQYAFGYWWPQTTYF